MIHEIHSVEKYIDGVFTEDFIHFSSLHSVLSVE